MATTYTWTATGNGSWLFGGNWSHLGSTGVPVKDADILIAGTATTTINYNTNPPFGFSSLTMTDPNATFFFTSGLRALSITTSGAGAINLQAGTINFGGTSGAQALNANNLTMTGGAIIEGANGTLTVSAGGVLSMSGGTITESGGKISTPSFVINGGALSGYGLISGSISGTPSGLVTASGGTLDFTGNVAASGPAFNINASSVLEFDGTVGSGDTVTFNSGTSGVLEFSNATALSGFNGVIAGLAANATPTSVSGSNFINVQSTVGAVKVVGTGTNTFNGSATSFTLYSDAGATTAIGTFSLASAPTAGTKVFFGADSAVGTGTLGGFDVYLVCYAAGTMILTEHGEVPIEALAAGDRVITLRDGQTEAQPIKWMGVRSVNITAHPAPHMAAPIRIRRGAFGDDMPRRDLLVSPAHAIFVDGKLVPANLLINHMTITQELDTKAVTYYHLELDQHAVIFAEGLTSESYLDTGNRAYFENAGLAMVLHPEFHVNAGLQCWEDDACAPLAIDAETIAPIWSQLAARAEHMGYVPPALTTTQDADIHLVANGRRLRPVASSNGRYSFMLPAGVTDLRLMSRATAPADLNPLSGDWRPLGVAVRTLTLRDGDDHQVLAADHPGLTQGWHTAERDERNLWRWTNGNAVLPLTTRAPAMLDIELGQVAQYIIARSDVADVRLAA